MSARLLVVLCLAACTHDQPFAAGSYVPGGPRGAGAPLRLTYNSREDLGPVWLPDGSGFFYTMERSDRDDLDRCLVLMAGSGGSIEREICDRIPAADDSVDAFTAAAVSVDGRLAYVRATTSFAAGWPLAPFAQQLVVASLTDPISARVLRTIPYPGPSGRVHQGVTQVRWLSDSSLVYVGQQVSYPATCPNCVLRDTLASGLEIVRIDFGGSNPVLTMLPGSDQASSVTVAGRDTVYFTLNGDTRVFRLTLSNDSIAVVHDFGAGNIARDVQVAGGRVVAVVGGNVSFTVDSVVGGIQRDSGGTIVLVDPTNGNETPLTSGALYRHPALSPDGRHIVVEAYAGRTTDLWLVESP